MNLTILQSRSVIQDCRTLCDLWQEWRYHRGMANEKAKAIRSLCHSRGVHIGNRVRAVALMIFMVCGMAAAAGPGNLRTNITLSFDFPTNLLSTNVLFKFYSSTTITQPVNQWPLYASVVGTNTSYTFPIDAVAGQRWFVMTASNWWGETSFSNVTNTQPVLPSLVNVSIGQ